MVLVCAIAAIVLGVAAADASRVANVTAPSQVLRQGLRSQRVAQRALRQQERKAPQAVALRSALREKRKRREPAPGTSKQARELPQIPFGQNASFGLMESLCPTRNYARCYIDALTVRYPQHNLFLDRSPLMHAQTSCTRTQTYFC